MSQEKGSNVSSEPSAVTDTNAKKDLDSTAVPKENFFNFQNTVIIILAIAILAIAIFFGIYLIRNSQKGGGAQENASSSGSAATVPVTPLANENPESTADESLDIGSTEPVANPEIKKADLYVKSYTFSESPKEDDEFTVKIVIGNKGLIDAEDFYWEWWASSSERPCKEKIGLVSSGGAITVSCNYTYSDHSSYTTKVVLDSGYNISESNESNNVVTKVITPIHEEEKPDLYVTSVSFNHDPWMGQEFRASITIKNKGGSTDEHSEWEWWAASAAKACDGEIDGLDAGESKTVFCDYTYGGWANYTTKAIVDVDDEVDESNEGNNTYTKAVTPKHLIQL